MLRPATNADSAAVTALIDSVYQEYGEILFLEGADADLLDIDGRYAAKGGAFVVWVEGGEVAGSHAALPVDVERGILTLRRLYLRPALRGTGVGAQLMRWGIDWGKARGFREIQFWSDTRFTRAHRFFKRLGFEQGGIREMHDGALPYQEHFFSMPIA